MTQSLNGAIVRIRAGNGRVIGAGFLVGERQVLTCAHVVADALGIQRSTQRTPPGDVPLDFSLVAPDECLTAKVVYWHQMDDIAGLELPGEPPDGVQPTRLVQVDDPWGHMFLTFGFPAGYDDGVWASGRILAQQAAGWIQIEDVKQTGYFVAPGFSGGPVWDEQVRGVIGMIVGADRDPSVRAAYMVPAATLLSRWPELQLAAPRTPEPRDDGATGVFISHRSQDAARAERLAEALQQAGFQVWLDEWDIHLGDSIVERINAGLEEARYVLLCYSEAGVLSPWMSREWMSALARQLEGYQVTVLPVRLSGGRPPAILADIRYADLVKYWDQGITELLRAMR